MSLHVVYSESVVVDQRSQLKISEWNKLLTYHVTARKSSGVVSHNALSIGKPNPAYLPQHYAFICLDFSDIL